MLRKISDILVFSSLYIACCAVLMTWQTSRILLGTAPSDRLMGFVFFSTICSYNFHWYLNQAGPVRFSSKLPWGRYGKVVHFILYLAGAIGSAIYFFSLLRYWPELLFGAAVTFLYSAPKLPYPIFRGLKKIAIGKTIFLSLVWTYVTAILPVFIAGAPLKGTYILFACSRFFLIYAICILFDYKDREEDKKDEIRSLVTWLDEKGIDKLFILSLALFAVTTLGLAGFHFPGFYILLLLIPGIILAVLYQRAKRDFSDFLYYIVLDGLMMFSALLMLIFRI